MEFKRWPAFLALSFTLSFRAFSLAQELNDKPDVPSANPQPVIGTIVVEDEGKDEENSTEKPGGEVPNAGPGDASGWILIDDGTVGPIRLHGTNTIRGFSFRGLADAESLPKFVIGVSLTEVPDSLRAHIKLDAGVGIMVGAVVPESPAAKAGFQHYDILLKAGDQDLKHPKELQELVDTTAVKPLSITIQRHGEQKTLEVTPIKREELKNAADTLDWQTLLNQSGEGVFLDPANGQGPTPMSFDFPSGAAAPMVNPPQVDALTDSIRALTEQIERLQKAVDRLEKKSEPQENENHGYRTNDRNLDKGDCLKTPRPNPRMTLISIS